MSPLYQLSLNYRRKYKTALDILIKNRFIRENFQKALEVKQSDRPPAITPRTRAASYPARILTASAVVRKMENQKAVTGTDLKIILLQSWHP